MPRIADLTVSALLDAIAASTPTPGGGTAAAVSAAIGTSLLMMVAGLEKTRNNTDQERQKLADTRRALTGIRDRLLDLAQADAEAYDKVVAAFRLPKGTDEEKRARKAAIQEGMRGATEVPMDTLRAVYDAARSARTVAHCGNRSAASDVRVALELLEASAAGAGANVEINLAGLDDSAYRHRMASTLVDLSNSLSETLAAARSALKDTPSASGV